MHIFIKLRIAVNNVVSMAQTVTNPNNNNPYTNLNLTLSYFCVFCPDLNELILV